jgi:proteasome accessory factor PafA2
MSVRRVMGLETEYGITAPGDPSANPMVLSGLVVRAYAAAAGPERALPTGSGWDYADETPLRDARGFEMGRALADASQLTDVDDPTTANSVLANGARLYVDHAHPEYSSPEVSRPLDAVRWDRAGELVMRTAAASLERQGQPVRLYKNNVDGKGASYGTHENYLLPRDIPFARIAEGLIPFFVARQVICGAGRVGIGPQSQESGFQLSQRADYIETEIGLETTLKRPIVNTRDEPHASAEKYRRLHVILGDANLADVSTLLKLGVTSLVLRLIETGREPRVRLAQPVAAVRTISRDPSLKATVELTDGSVMTGLDLLAVYREAVDQAFADGADGWDRDPDTDQVLALWDDVTERLAGDPMSCTAEVDWVAKLSLLQAYRDRDGLGWEDPRLRAIDIQYSDVDPARGLGVRLRSSGRLTSLVDEAAVEEAVAKPPEDTRAWFRGECVRRFQGQVRAASWDSVVFAVDDRTLRRVSLPEPLLGARADSGELLDRSESAASLLERLGSR